MKKEDRAKEVCKGCELSEGNGDPPGSIIVKLDGGWILNHYGGPEGFLGWLALQPKRHVMRLAKLNDVETSALGHNIKLVDKALTDYWIEHFSRDRLERVYIVYFFESAFDECSEKYHLHIHLIPRTKRMGKGAYGRGTPSQTAAWRIHGLTGEYWFPEEYRIRDIEGNKIDEKVTKLMTYLDGYCKKEK